LEGRLHEERQIRHMRCSKKNTNLGFNEKRNEIKEKKIYAL
jgi:hypothetical protein